MTELLYVSCADALAIEILELAADGALHRRTTVPVPVPGSAAAATSVPLALSPDRTRLYAAVRAPPYPLASFAVAPDGGLTLLGITDLPHAMAYITVAGGHLLSASYPGSLLASHPIGADGAAHGPASQVTATPEKAHCIVADPSGRFVYVPCLGGDVILHLILDQATGTLRPAGEGGVPVRPGAGPRHLRFGADGRFAYVVNELDATIDTYAFEPSTGALALCQTVATLPPGTEGRIAAADLQVTPDGRFLYASERLTNILSGWRIDAATGILTPLGGLDVAANPNWITFLGG